MPGALGWREGVEWYHGLDPLTGLCGDQDEDGWLCVRTRGDSVCLHWRDDGG